MKPLAVKGTCHPQCNPRTLRTWLMHYDKTPKGRRTGVGCFSHTEQEGWSVCTALGTWSPCISKCSQEEGQGWAHCSVAVFSHYMATLRFCPFLTCHCHGIKMNSVTQQRDGMWMLMSSKWGYRAEGEGSPASTPPRVQGWEHSLSEEPYLVTHKEAHSSKVFSNN